jgi:hypothetical protein
VQNNQTANAAGENAEDAKGEESKHLVQKLRPVVPRKGKRKGKEELDELKQELEMDEHKVPLGELYERLGTDPNVVSSIMQRFVRNNRGHLIHKPHRIHIIHNTCTDTTG